LFFSVLSFSLKKFVYHCVILEQGITSAEVIGLTVFIQEWESLALGSQHACSGKL